MDPSGAPGIPILRTKVSLPRPHPETTPRLALEARLRSALAYKLVLINAPAGYGKTTLLARVLGDSNYPIAWLSLDERDNSSVRFWDYLIASLQSVRPGVGETALALLNAPQAPPFESVLVELVNDLAKSGQELILVLDDLHEISAPEILEELAELIARTPSNLHLVLASRQFPDLPLARLRARRDLVEFTAADLQFQTPEIEHLFNQLFALDLSLEDLGTLEKLTEGWIAGLQLAALVLRAPVPGALTVENLVESFQKGHQYVFDYLAQEVLDRQTPELRSFIVQAGFLPRLGAAVCDASLQRTDSQVLLEQVANANLFLTPLDAERRWYRYHNLFASCLRRILLAEQSPETIHSLVMRAAGWFESQGLIHDAVELAIAYDIHELVVQIVERNATSLFKNSELVSLTAWLKPLPFAIYEKSPLLGMVYAWASLATAQTEPIDTVLQAVERGIGCAADGSAGSFEQPPAIRGALAEICCLRASQAFNRFDLPAVLENSQQVRMYLAGHDGDSLFNKRLDILSIAAFNEGLVLAFTGKVNAAAAVLEESVRLCEQANNIHLLPMANAHLSNVYLVQGRLSQAESILNKTALTRLAGPQLSPMSGVAFARLGLIAYERNQLVPAKEYLQQGLDQGRRWNSWESALLGHVGMARLYQAQGEPLKALAEIDSLAAIEAEQQFGPVARSAALFGAELALRQGELARAQSWLAGSGLQVDGPIEFYTEEAMLMQARILLASRRDAEAIRLTGRLLGILEEQSRMGQVLEVLLLQSILYERQGDDVAMNQTFGQALDLAEAEGYQRTLIDLGADFAVVARAYTGPHREYLNKLVASQIASSPPPEVFIGKAEKLRKAGMLSQREVEVLRLVAEGRTNQEIADHLFISLNTVKTHVRHIFQCLDARNRAEAISLARDNQLI